VAREEIKNPVHRNDKPYLININTIGIDGLAHAASAYGTEPGFDEEANEYYETIVRLSGGMEAYLLQANQLLTNYYAFSGRWGLAFSYLQKNLDYYRSVNNVYGQINATNDFANLYGEMGQLELRDHYRDEAMKMADRYFILDKQPLDENEWLGYDSFLGSKMDDVAGPGRADQVAALWAKIEPITKRYIYPESLSYTAAANYFAMSGDAETAVRLLKTAEALMETETEKQADIRHDFICKSGQVALHTADYETAAELLTRCLAIWQERGIDPGESSFRVAGLAYEKAGLYDKAIDAYRRSIARVEVSRSSFSVPQRATFFRSSVRRSYWGLTRCFIHRYRQSGAEADFLEALHASEQIRGRQFGDLMETGDAGRITPQALAAFQGGLSDDQAVLAYLLTDQDIILFAFSRQSSRAFIIPYDRPTFRGQVMSAAAGMADPRTSLAAIHSSLKAISPVLLGPVRSLAAEKRRLVVLPDGAINAIPFDVLTLDDKAYQPLIQTHVVKVAPSLSYMLQRRAAERPAVSRGLFAVADPVYSQDAKVGALDRSQIQVVTRSNRFLSYFTPLPETRDEVETISALFEGEPIEKLYGANASESKIKEMDLHRYRYIHMATHGILGSDLPGLEEPALVMAEESGQDCFLTASEAQALDLDADLAVLSACNTGSGKYFTGEGVMGMSRAFLLAGSRSVLVSLWSVPSEETVLIMISFYKHLKQGDTIAEAIRNAKLELLRNPPKGRDGARRGVSVAKSAEAAPSGLHPVYWAAFIPLGT
jgi:CHAT domain-containing protein/tetratricopeptide (TPR) repeat protein